MAERLKDEFDYYLANQEELTQLYNGKFIVIKNHQVIGVYNSELEAITETARQHELGTFLVQRCEPGKDAYTQMYHSRVVLA